MGYHGKGGAFTITENDEPDPLSDAFIDAVVNLGIPRNSNYNGRALDQRFNPIWDINAVVQGVNYCR